MKPLALHMEAIVPQVDFSKYGEKPIQYVKKNFALFRMSFDFTTFVTMELRQNEIQTADEIMAMGGEEEYTFHDIIL